MTERKIGIIMNGVTGRMGTHQHLVRSILAIRDQGGIHLPGGEVGHARSHSGGAQRSQIAIHRCRARDSPLHHRPESRAGQRELTPIYFDAQTDPARFSALREAILRGKHVYCEKPVAGISRRIHGISAARECARSQDRRGDGQAVPARHSQAAAPCRLRFLRQGFIGARRTWILCFRGRLAGRPASLLERAQGRRRRNHPRYAAALALFIRAHIRKDERESFASAPRRFRNASTSAASASLALPRIPRTPCFRSRAD